MSRAATIGAMDSTSHDAGDAGRPIDPRSGWALLIGATAVLGVWSRLRVVGTPEADAVEYLERAQGLVQRSS